MYAVFSLDSGFKIQSDLRFTYQRVNDKKDPDKSLPVETSPWFLHFKKLHDLFLQ